MNEPIKNLQEKVISKINSNYILNDELPEVMKQKQIIPVVTTIRINPKIKDLANICAFNEKTKKETWVENLILREAKEKHNIELPEFQHRINQNDN